VAPAAEAENWTDDRSGDLTVRARTRHRALGAAPDDGAPQTTIP
jgi:hypothetical protein